MTEELIISVSGMRGIVGSNLTAVIASDYGCAFGTFLKAAGGAEAKLTVCVGADSRGSGAMLKSAVTAGLCAVGVDVIDIGLAATPSVGVMTKQLRCAGGVIITASHNPIQYNGIKLLLSNGIAPSAKEAEQIKKGYFDKAFDLADSADYGQVSFNEHTHAVHIDKVLGLVSRQAIGDRGFKVVLDSVNGAGGPIGKKLLSRFGCEVIAINDEPTGLFAHAPEPIAENLTALCDVVKNECADIGFAQDPDADRLAIVDENGCYIGEEYTLALAAKYIFSKGSGKAATNLSTSRMIDDIAQKAGGQVIRTAVGEANVAGAMIENNCIIGGEGNGGVIDLRLGPIRDSLVAIAVVLQLMAETGKTVSELVTEISRYYMSKEKFSADKSQAERIIESAKKVFKQARLDDRDGCRFDFADGWVHLRCSNTEPVMRLIVEAEDKASAEKYIEAVSKIRKDIIG